MREIADKLKTWQNILRTHTLYFICLASSLLSTPFSPDRSRVIARVPGSQVAAENTLPDYSRMKGLGRCNAG
jgi:hypothetical protein